MTHIVEITQKWRKSRDIDILAYPPSPSWHTMREFGLRAWSSSGRSPLLSRTELSANQKGFSFIYSNCLSQEGSGLLPLNQRWLYTQIRVHELVVDIVWGHEEDFSINHTQVQLCNLLQICSWIFSSPALAQQPIVFFAAFGLWICATSCCFETCRGYFPDERRRESDGDGLTES
jgi:hypothetical protein